MAYRSDFASLDVAGRRLDAWESYEVTSDLLTPADSWSVAVPFGGTRAERRDVLAAIRGNPVIQLYIGRDVTGTASQRALQLTGIVDKIAVADSRKEATTLRLSGRDKGGLLASASADVTLGVSAETELVSFVRQLCQPYEIEVVTEFAHGRNLLTGATQSDDRDRLMEAQARAFGIPLSMMRRQMARRAALEGGRPLDEESGASASTSRAAGRAREGRANGMTGSDVERVRVREAKPSVGETVWDFIDRHCRRFGILPWMDPLGRLVLGAPDYNQRSIGRLQRWLDGSVSPTANNIVAGGFVEDIGVQPTSVRVYGRAHGHDETRSPHQSEVLNGSAPGSIFRPLIIHDASVRSDEEAQRRALRELNRLTQEAFVLEYEVRDHGQGRYLYAIDTVLDVSDEAIDVEGRYYVISRTFRKTRDEGTTTLLRLVPLHAIQL
jgi:prophage tail gpP-like protein